MDNQGKELAQIDYKALLESVLRDLKDGFLPGEVIAKIEHKLGMKDNAQEP